MSTKNNPRNIYNNPIIKHRMVVIKNQNNPTNIKKQINPSQQINKQQQTTNQQSNNIENLIIGTVSTHNTSIDPNLYNKFKNRREIDNKQFKDKSKYLQNIPYKAISDKKEFDKKINSSEDLIISHVTNTRQNRVTIEKNIAKTINDRKQFDLEQQCKFTSNKQVYYKKQFDDEINGRFNNVNISQNDSSDLKKDSYKYHEKCQQELEKNRQNVDLIIDQLIDNPMF